jgi:hypothetical protein
MKEALFGMVGILVGAFITYLSNYFLEKSKNKMAMQKHLFELKRERLEEFYKLIDNSINFAVDMMSKMNIILYKGRNNKDEKNYKSNADDFKKLTNIINMYFDNDKILKDLIIEANQIFENSQKINESILFEENNDKDKINNKLVKNWKLFGNKLIDIKKEIPRVFKSLN